MIVRYLSVEEITSANKIVVNLSGGGTGLREPGMLESIINKPKAAFGGEDLYPDLFLKAAVLFEAIVNYHVFVDGNKRTAFVCMELFLSHNKVELAVSDQEIVDFCVDTAKNNPDLAEVAVWIKKHSIKN